MVMYPRCSSNGLLSYSCRYKQCGPSVALTSEQLLHKWFPTPRIGNYSQGRIAVTDAEQFWGYIQVQRSKYIVVWPLTMEHGPVSTEIYKHSRSGLGHRHHTNVQRWTCCVVTRLCYGNGHISWHLSCT